MLFHLGPLGDLHALPVIESDAEPDASASAPGADFVSLKGARSRDRLGPHRRTWGLEWRYLELADFDLLDAMRRGHLGGPLRLVDPSLPNLLNAQIATGGTEERSVRGWTTVAGGRRWVRPNRRPDGVLAVGAIEWTKPTALDELATGREIEAFRVPCPPDGGPMAFAARMMRSDAPGDLAVTPGFDMWDVAGNRTTGVASTPQTVTGQWSEVTVLIADTTGIAAVAPMWRIGTVSASVYVTGVRAAWGTAAPPPSRGGGAPVVTFGDLGQTYPSEAEFSFSATLNEA